MMAARKRARRALPLALAALVATATLAIAWWWAHPPDPAVELRASYRPLTALERRPVPALGRGLERWRMIAAGSDTVTGLWRAAAPGRASEWVVVVLGGIGTDDRAALLLPDSLPVGVLAVSWPWKGSRHLGRLEFLASVPALRSALLGSPGAVARGVEAVRRASPGARVSLVGASAGAPPTLAALRFVRPEALVIVDGAADLDRLLRSEATRTLGGGIVGGILGPPAGALAARLLSSLEPARSAEAARGLPVLLVNAEHDERYPPECVARLEAAFPGAAKTTHPGEHMRPGNRRQITAIVEAAWRWLASTGGR